MLDLVQDPALPPGDVDAYLRTRRSGTYSGFARCFANGLSAREAAELAASQRPIAVGSLAEPSGVPAWLTIPSWDLVGTSDNVIPQLQQLMMAARAGAHIRRFAGGHVGLISHPDAVVDIIVAAIRATD